MGIRLVKGGLFTTIQDYGRVSLQSQGFHVSGVMDRRAYRLANILVDNDDNEAVLEFTLMGPTICFTTDTVIAITGGNFKPSLNGEPIQMYKAVEVKKGDELVFNFSIDGTWGYIAFAGGLDTPVVLGSRSTDVKSELGGIEGRKLTDGDEIDFITEKSRLTKMNKRQLAIPEYKSEVATVRVVMGPQEDYFSRKGIDTFLGTEYKISNRCDRMGYRLEGEEIEHNEKGADIISDGIAYGAIQVPAQGLPIVMLSDRQTTGGYTKIATVISTDIPKLVQLRMNQAVHFEKIDVRDAQKVYIDEQKEYETLRKTVRGGGIFGFLGAIFGR